MRKWTWIVAVLTLSGTAWARCDHPYFPVREGWTWKYQSSLDNSSYTVRIESVSASGFIQRQTFENLSFESRWRCDSKGLTQLEYVQPQGLQGVQMNLKTRKASGVAIPQVMRVGTTWTYSYEVSGEAKQQNLTLQVEQSVTASNKVLGQESVTVPAGRFTALKVESILTTKGSMTIAGRKMPVNHTVKTFSWYAQGVGLVKSQFEGGRSELVSLKR